MTRSFETKCAKSYMFMLDTWTHVVHLVLVVRNCWACGCQSTKQSFWWTGFYMFSHLIERNYGADLQFLLITFRLVLTWLIWRFGNLVNFPADRLIRQVGTSLKPFYHVLHFEGLVYFARWILLFGLICWNSSTYSPPLYSFLRNVFLCDT